MHILFLAPDTHVYNHGFLGALKALGAKVSGLGMVGRDKLTPAAARLLDGYRGCDRMLEHEAVTKAARELATPAFDRIETIDEPLVEVAAALRGTFGVPGLPLATARLCRNKVAMKEFLREHEIPCAQSGAVTSAKDASAFAERWGYPVILKPIAGFGSLRTFRCATAVELEAALQQLKPSSQQPVAIEEFIEGHEGFFDSMCDGDGVRHEFAAHYYPGCLEATQHRWISPQIAVTNRIEQGGYEELRGLHRRVVDALGIRNAATHMEWFFGPKGLKFSEIGARPAGEKIWDMYRVANEFDVYREWALAILGRPSQQRPSRRYAAGSIQIRPDRDGRIVGHRGLEAALRRCGEWIYEQSIPAPGTPTKALERGWLVNTWFRLRHPDYDTLRELMDFLGETVKADAR
ncbi:MAG: ATP-grasp domain-containing protein [Planctomycetes bacterium]|nr:ATP-grasp domain-containing protein [Planctomycetota bacterium]